jgi:hypothetical protein
MAGDNLYGDTLIPGASFWPDDIIRVFNYTTGE